MMLYESNKWFASINLGMWGLPFSFDYDRREGHVFLFLCLQILYIPYGTYLPKEVK